MLWALISTIFAISNQFFTLVTFSGNGPLLYEQSMRQNLKSGLRKLNRVVVVILDKEDQISTLWPYPTL